MRFRSSKRFRELAQRRNIVENPERAAVRGHNQIVLVNPQIAHGGVRQVELERLPVVAVVEGDPHAGFGSGEQQTLPHGIFADGIDRRALRQPVRDQPPGLPAVMGAVNVRTEIVDAEAADRSIGGFVIEMRSAKLRDLAPGRDLGRRDVFPVGAAVSRNPEQAIVGARPNGGHVFERRRQRINDAANLSGAGILCRFVPQARRNRAVLAREIRADGLPGLSPVACLIQEIRRGIENMRIDRRENNGLRAVGAHFRIGRRNRGDVLELTRGNRKFRHLAAARAVNDVRIERIGRGVAVFDDAHGVPFAKSDFTVLAAAGDAD